MESRTNYLQSEEQNLPISTLIFMDVEATGLPSFLGKKNVHITEITLIAIDRSDFENDKSLRVLNKLSLCVRPRAEISPGAVSITGLYNDMLENQEQFDETVPKLMKYFFRRLRPPICLLAHNGRKYDFPLLQAELKRISYSLGPGVLCGDTLEALKSIINSPTFRREAKADKIVSLPAEVPYSSSDNEQSVMPGNQVNGDPADVAAKDVSSLSNGDITSSFNSDQDVEDLLLEDMDFFRSIDRELNDIEADSTKSACPSITVRKPNDELHDKDSMIYRNEHTPKGKSTIPDDKGVKRRKKRVSDPTFSPKKQYKSNGYVHTEVKRKLFYDCGAPKPVSFSLPRLYHHFFGEDPPQSHYAEADCITLSKVCQQVCPEFLTWIDKNSFPFDEIREMW